MRAFLHGYHIPNHPLAFEYLPSLFVTPCSHTVCVNTQHSVLCVSSICVTFSAPHWPSVLPFPSVYFGGGQVGLHF